MQQCVYVKFPKEVKISSTFVRLGDVGKLYCVDSQQNERLEQLPLIELHPSHKKEKYIISFLRVVQIIKSEFPDIDIENMGETDFVLSYRAEGNKEGQEKETGCSGVLEWAKTILVCLILFFGAAFTIMAFNTDVGVPELFAQLTQLVTGQEGSGRGVLELGYCLGLPIGILVFFDHFKPEIRRQDPTPMEVQMRVYEEDINNVLIQNAARDGRTISVEERKSKKATDRG